MSFYVCCPVPIFSEVVTPESYKDVVVNDPFIPIIVVNHVQ